MTLLSLASAAALLACSPVGGGQATTTSATEDGEGDAGTSDDAGSADTTAGDGDAGDGDGDGAEPICMMEKPMTECDPVNEGEECASEYCHAFSTVPVDPDAACAPNEGEGVLRMTGTIRNFATGEIVPNVPVKMAGALPTAQDPVNVQTVAETMSDGEGRFDVTTTEANQQAIGIVAIAGGADGFSLTGTGLVEPRIGTSVYPPGVRNHNVWVQESTILDRWSDLLAAEPELEPFLPLGEKGGVIGKIQDPVCGYGVAGVTIRSWLEDETFSHVRYLDQDRNGFNTEGTADHGLFVIMNPVLPEKFDALYEGQVVSNVEGTVGNAFGAIFTVTISVELP